MVADSAPSPETVPTDRAALSYRDHSVSFGPKVITREVSFDLVPGRILALVGESGSGKSVTALAALGLAGSAEQTGSVLLSSAGLTGAAADSRELVGLDPTGLRGVRGAEIGIVFQEPMSAFNPMFRLGHQIAEAVRAHRHREGSSPGGAEPAGGAEATAGAASAAETSVRDRVRAQLVKVGLDDPDRIMRAYPHQLSGGQLQRAMIALATVNAPRVLIADEPTTALDVTVQTGILDLLRSQATEEGQAVFLITHDMGVVADIADEVAVMKNGRIVEQGKVDELFSDPQEEYTRQLLAAVPRLGDFGSGRSKPETGSSSAPDASTAPDGSTAPAIAAELRSATVVHRSSAGPVTAIEGIDLQIPAGSITGLVGESGSGKSTIATVLTGGQKLSSGQVFVDGQAVSTRPNRAQRRRRADIGVVFQDPRGALNPRRTIGSQIGEPLRVHRRLDSHTIDARVAALLDDVQLPGDFAERYPHELSGGQRQRVAIARALALDPKLLIADEPTSALDVSVQRGVLRLLAELHEVHDFACLFISHDLAVIEQLASTVVVLRHGAIVEQGTSAQVLTAPQQAYTKELIESAPLPDPQIQAARRAARLAA
ncbi:ABC transporter ATP-binding protein [Brevibacterium sediminis]|uniref:ATP-binding cassette domain-containing protein n=1 Tax=Brevibacterium sediminis TaxID=1857024 RepID=UPI002174FDF7|nr:ABC transporter ATP-binding protein [Brevibacterium sediminis]MCS4593656.1 ABC transporter ATP-binding protein [Brevibacterium sediminis]